MDTKDRCFLRPNPPSEQIIKCALEVHSALGAGMLESAITACMLYEMTSAGLHIDHQVRLPITYKGLEISAAYRIDFIVEKCVLLEIKCVEKLLPVHAAQLLIYVRWSGRQLGLLINFNVPHLRNGIRRIINGPETELD